MTGPPPAIDAGAWAQNALSLILQAAGHPLLGDMALHQGEVKEGNPTSLQDQALLTGPGDQSWRRSWMLYLGADYAGPAPGPNAGQERFIQQVDGATGAIRWQPPLPGPPAPGDRYVLFRDYRWAQWLRWLNETARNIHFPLDVAVAAGPEHDRLRYTMPEVIKRAGWLQDVLIGPANVAYTSPEARTIRWYHVNPASVEGDLYLVLSRPLAQHQQILFRARPPFAFETDAPYTTLGSVLLPLSGSPPYASQGGVGIVPPVRLFVLGTAWRSLQQKLVNLTGQPRKLWLENLERCARQYAQACAEWGVREVGRDLGYTDDWYPFGTLDYSTG